jgi:hypothetical protein
VVKNIYKSRTYCYFSKYRIQISYFLHIFHFSFSISFSFNSKIFFSVFWNVLKILDKLIKKNKTKQLPYSYHTNTSLQVLISLHKTKNRKKSFFWKKGIERVLVNCPCDGFSQIFTIYFAIMAMKTQL